MELVGAGATGEYVCVSARGELHVFLQRGRIAWATDSSAPLAFRRYLLDHTLLTPEILADVLESCRRDRLPLGETLIAWKVATFDDIRAALRCQIDRALVTLEALDEGRTIFLERTREFAMYNSELTFALNEFVEERSGVRDSSVVAIAGGGILERVRTAIPELSCALVFEREAVVESTSETAIARVPPSIIAQSLDDGADVLALRSLRGTVIGTSLPSRGRYVAARLPADVAFGPALATLCTTCGVEPALRRATSVQRAALRAMGGDGDDGRPRIADAARRFLEQAGECVAAVVLEGEHVAGAARADLDSATISRIASRRARLLARELPSDSNDVNALEQLGYSLRSVMTGEGAILCFGIELDTQRTAWLFMDRACAQGLGWAYLLSFSRQLHALP